MNINYDLIHLICDILNDPKMPQELKDIFILKLEAIIIMYNLTK